MTHKGIVPISPARYSERIPSTYSMGTRRELDSAVEKRIWEFEAILRFQFDLANILHSCILKYNPHFESNFAISHQFPDCPHIYHLQDTVKVLPVQTPCFTLILLTYCTFAYYITIRMLRAISQFPIDFANIPHVRNNSTFLQSLHLRNNHTCNMIWTEGSKINLR